MIIKVRHFVFALVAVCMFCAFIIPILADAAAPAVKVNYTTETLEITVPSSEKYVYYAVAKTKYEKADKIRQWEAVPVIAGKGTIDISFLKDKESFLITSIDKTDENSAIVVIPERQIKLKGGFNYVDSIGVSKGYEHYDTLTITSSGIRSDSGKLYKWKSGKYGEYQTMYALTTAAIDRYCLQGTTLYFYEIANDTIGKGARSSKEFAIKIKKAANAPKVTVDMSKISVKITDGSEYKLTKDTNWISITGEPISLSSIADSTKNDVELVAPIQFEVRNRYKNMGRIASKVRVVDIPAQGAKPIKDVEFKLYCTEQEISSSIGSVIRPASNELLPNGNHMVEYQIVLPGTIFKVSDKWTKLTKATQLGSLPKDTKLYIRKMATKATKEKPAAMASQSLVLTVDSKNIFPIS